jgi:hypothetical protein
MRWSPRLAKRDTGAAGGAQLERHVRRARSASAHRSAKRRSSSHAAERQSDRPCRLRDPGDQRHLRKRGVDAGHELIKLVSRDEWSP